MLKFLLFIILAYLFGSLSTAIITAKVFGLTDPRTEGSGNPGATNVLRVSGKKVAIIVLLGDFIKGLIPVLLAKWASLTPYALAWVGFAAILGHVFPLFFGFKGGKGVATGAGVLFGLSFPLGLASILTWILVAALTRYSSLAAVIATLTVPIFAYWPGHVHAFLPILLICLLLLWRHRENVRKLLKGEEDKIGEKL